jgi:hypothetical protein
MLNPFSKRPTQTAERDQSFVRKRVLIVYDCIYISSASIEAAASWAWTKNVDSLMLGVAYLGTSTSPVNMLDLDHLPQMSVAQLDLLIQSLARPSLWQRVVAFIGGGGK